MNSSYDIYFHQGTVDHQSLEIKECNSLIFTLPDPQPWNWDMMSNDYVKNPITESRQSITLQENITIWQG